MITMVNVEELYKKNKKRYKAIDVKTKYKRLRDRTVPPKEIKKVKDTSDKMLRVYDEMLSDIKIALNQAQDAGKKKTYNALLNKYDSISEKRDNYLKSIDKEKEEDPDKEMSESTEDPEKEDEEEEKKKKKEKKDSSYTITPGKSREETLEEKMNKKEDPEKEDEEKEEEEEKKKKKEKKDSIDVEDPPEAYYECISKTVDKLKKDHPDWDKDRVKATAINMCKEKKL